MANLMDNPVYRAAVLQLERAQGTAERANNSVTRWQENVAQAQAELAASRVDADLAAEWLLQAQAALESVKNSEDFNAWLWQA